MSLETAEIPVFGSGHVYTAPVGTAFPANISAAVNQAAGWKDHGYTTVEGVRFSFARESTDLEAWQSFDPVRTLITKVPKTVSFDLLQWNQFTIQLALGGGTVTGADPNYEYSPPDPSFVDDRALIIEGTDDDKTYRFCYRKALNKSGIDFAMVRTNASPLAITMSILAADNDADPFIIQSNDDNFGLLADAGS